MTYEEYCPVEYDVCPFIKFTDLSKEPVASLFWVQKIFASEILRLSV